MKKYTFYTTNPDGTKVFFGEVTVVEKNPKNYFRRSIALLTRKSRDLADFLYIKGNHLYFWNNKLTWETA